TVPGAKRAPRDPAPAGYMAEVGRLDQFMKRKGGINECAAIIGSEDEFHRQFNTNVLGTLLATREAVKHFGNHGGSVINITSVASNTATPTNSVYSATKSALEAVTRVLAAELGPRRIRVNAIAPGGVETEGLHALGVIGSDFEKQMVADTPLGRL